MKITEIKDKQIKNDNIDWNKPMWLISDDDSIVISTGIHSGNEFSGTMLPSKGYNNGKFSDVWFKKFFKPLQSDLTIVIGN
ncbi:MAG: hypothetical protein ACOVSR_08955 [Bacteroidia bacterium]